MAERDPNLPQSSDPELQADLVRLLQVQGPLGLLNVLDVVIPTVSMGQVVPLEVQQVRPSFRPTDIVSGVLTSPVPNTLVVQTGGLPAGTYDLIASIETSGNSGAGASTRLEHRDAADAVTLASLLVSPMSGTNLHATTELQLIGYEIALNEQLRAFVYGPGNVTGTVTAVIWARIRG